MTSIIIPCRNEEEGISWCLDPIVENDYPKKNLEVLVVDGMSDDQTRSILHFYVKRYSYIRILDNPKIEQPIGLNIGIKSSKGDIVIRLDAHSKYKSNYISECVNALLSYGADNVGGRWVTTPRENTLIGRSICFATSVHLVLEMLIIGSIRFIPMAQVYTKFAGILTFPIFVVGERFSTKLDYLMKT